jgi:hypothetical protein
VGARGGETGATEFDTCFSDGVTNAGGTSEDEYGGVVEFGGEFGRQRGEGGVAILEGQQGSDGNDNGNLRAESKWKMREATG